MGRLSVKSSTQNTMILLSVVCFGACPTWIGPMHAMTHAGGFGLLACLR